MSEGAAVIAEGSGTCTCCGERMLLSEWPAHRERVHGSAGDLCHCGEPVTGDALGDLGPATRHLCERCLWVRCDVTPGVCR